MRGIKDPHICNVDGVQKMNCQHKNLKRVGASDDVDGCLDCGASVRKMLDDGLESALKFEDLKDAVFKAEEIVFKNKSDIGMATIKAILTRYKSNSCMRKQTFLADEL